VIRLNLARGWRTDLPRLVLLLQAGNAVSFFGYGLILPFEIIYLHQIRGFATATAGLVLAAILGTATLVTPPSGALLDHFRPKPILIGGNLTSALGYAGFAFVNRPWQAFACAVVGGAGVGAARTANQTLLITLVTPEQRAASFALGPGIGGAVLATSPDAVWWGGALVAAVIGAGFLLSGDRIPEPLALEAAVPDVGEGPRAATQATN
jgi:MFS family permease